MTGKNPQCFGQGDYPFVDRSDDLSVIAPRQVGSSYRTLEEGVSREEKPVSEKANAALGVAGSVYDRKNEVSDPDLIRVFQKP